LTKPKKAPALVIEKHTVFNNIFLFNKLMHGVMEDWKNARVFAYYPSNIPFIPNHQVHE